MSPFAGYDLRFVISPNVFDVMTFEKQMIFEACSSKKFARYEKTKVISSKGGHMNFLVLCTKMYGKLY